MLTALIGYPDLRAARRIAEGPCQLNAVNHSIILIGKGSVWFAFAIHPPMVISLDDDKPTRLHLHLTEVAKCRRLASLLIPEQVAGRVFKRYSAENHYGRVLHGGCGRLLGTGNFGRNTR